MLGKVLLQKYLDAQTSAAVLRTRATESLHRGEMEQYEALDRLASSAEEETARNLRILREYELHFAVKTYELQRRYVSNSPRAVA